MCVSITQVSSGSASLREAAKIRSAADICACKLTLARATSAGFHSSQWCHVGTDRACAAGCMPAGDLQAYSIHCFRINVANWTLLMLAALAMAGSITWLTTMSTALSATQQGGGYGKSTLPAPPTAARPTEPAAAAAAALSDVGQVWAVRACPPGCIDLGLIAEVLGLPWPCFCQVWLLGDLVEQLQKVRETGEGGAAGW